MKQEAQAKQIPLSQSNKKKLWRRLVIIVILFVLILLIGGCSWLFYEVALTPSSPLDINRSRGTSTAIELNSAGSAQEDKREWFDAVEEAVLENEAPFERLFISESLMTVEAEDRIDALFFVEYDDNGTPFSEFVVYRFDKKDDKVAMQTGVAYYALTDLDIEFNSAYYYETEKERIAEYIDQCIKNPSKPIDYPFANFGVSENPDIEEMTILGQHPDDVIEYTYGETTYYFWYYDNLPIQEYLLDHPDFSYDDYTLRQLIEVLEIEAPETES